MSHDADLMETYTTPASATEEQPERQMSDYIICLPAYPEWDHDMDSPASPAQQDAARKATKAVKCICFVSVDATVH